MSSSAVEYARQNHPRFLHELKALLRIPSVSTLPEHKGDCHFAAEVLAAELSRIGMENVRIIETGKTEGHPLVYADWLHAAGKPTVLATDTTTCSRPIRWMSGCRRHLSRRSATATCMRAARWTTRARCTCTSRRWSRCWQRHGKLPLNVRVLLEGEEEVGGEGIARYVASKPAELKADFALVSDTELFAPGLPTLCVGLRGMIYTELEVRGAKTDLHSGMYGGAAPNPFVALCADYCGLKDEHGHILIPGFYDDIIPPSAEELAAWRSLPFDEEHYRITEVERGNWWARAGYSVLERTWARPTLDVHGIPGGFIGAGAKTVIPAKAVAKVSMRLVPGMTPAKAFALYKSYVEEIAPAGVDVEVRLIHSGDPCLIPVDNPYMRRRRGAARGLGQGHGVYPVGRVDSDCGGLCTAPGIAQRDDGLRIAGR
jgi:acetylornithine deacetylase/succinyl-diaminopimelate desuccinylase-like protein